MLLALVPLFYDIQETTMSLSCAIVSTYTLLNTLVTYIYNLI